MVFANAPPPPSPHGKNSPKPTKRLSSLQMGPPAPLLPEGQACIREYQAVNNEKEERRKKEEKTLSCLEGEGEEVETERTTRGRHGERMRSGHGQGEGDHCLHVLSLRYFRSVDDPIIPISAWIDTGSQPLLSSFDAPCAFGEISTTFTQSSAWSGESCEHFCQVKSLRVARVFRVLRLARLLRSRKTAHELHMRDSSYDSLVPVFLFGIRRHLASASRKHSVGAGSGSQKCFT